MSIRALVRGLDKMEPASKRRRLDDAGSSSHPYAHPDSDQHCNEAQDSFTGQGIHNREGHIGVGRDININNYGPGTQRHGVHVGLEERRRAILESLQFAQMDARQMSIKQAHAKTCRWFLKDPEYLQWSKNDGAQSEGSFLWIKGKPGAGKSTLMKFLLKQTRRSRSEGIIISFFFNARGEDMEKTTLGLYQSLLVQLLEVRPGLQSILDRFRNGQPQWCVEILQEIFEEAVEGLDETSLVCFIDALDECQEQEVRDMIRFLSELSDAKSRLRVCFASRHYPHITIPKGRSIVLEDKSEHQEDIAKYIDNSLHIGGGKLSQQIRSELQEKASGVFMWVVLVVDILNKECDTGHKHTLRNRLRQIPGDLHALFRDILTRDSHNAPGLLLCIQWVLFAMRPLSPRQLYFAVLAGVEPESLADCHTDDITNDDISKFILDKSKGLAESTKSKLPTIQFIHESVRDFLLKDNGLQAIWQGDSAHLEGQSHEALKGVCFTYMTCDHVSYGIEALVPHEKLSKQEDKDRRTDVNGRFPFLEYATQAVLYHADKAEVGKQSQADFLSTFPLARWVKQHNIFEQHHVRRFTPNVSLLYVLAHENRGALIGIQQEDRSCYQEEFERYGTPLFAALVLKCVSAVQALIERQKRRTRVDLSLSDLDVPTSPEDDCFRFFRRDFHFHRGRGVLFYIAQAHGRKLVEIFYATEVVDAKLKDELGGFPLSYVAQGKNVELAKLLLQRGADVNALSENFSDRGMMPLHHAAETGATEMVEFLVSRGARLDAIDRHGRTPLHYASQSNTVETVELLVNRGAQLNAINKSGQTPLLTASKRGSREIVRVLLEKGANAAISDRDTCSPLHYATKHGDTEMVRILIDKGADAKRTSQHSHETPLHWASAKGNIEIVRLLIERGADIHATTNRGETPLHNVSRCGHVEIVRLLIERGADIHATTNDRRTPLHVASLYGHVEVVRLLIERGASIYAPDCLGYTPLHEASRCGKTGVVGLLLKEGADIHATTSRGETPHDLASERGLDAVAQLLIEKGA